ncbi:dipeptidase PepV [Candidatus Xianfuyuplasma coldseepsis]|uniref:Dipeptidase PepV n=1 Tax=Candidatus Xianfuyuplasma coldseepsis TaxID=2782163 RepID=A0A7L7KS41_9MOLU|nr:dipeptidase PepV [Xianfuyuplasma coldseepsis]QMS85537.1 dipeptidase PepV [Xianfuyuplasma coldseepsis]
MDFYQYVLDHQDELLKKAKELLQIPSVLDKFNPESDTPFGQSINDALHYMLGMAQADGFITKNINNYAAHIEYGSGKEIVGVLCHLDVVPTGDGWSNPPFDPIIKDGKLFARGAGDDKGPTMAAYFALKFLKEMDVELHKRVRIILGTDEETEWRGIKEYFKTEEMPDIGFAPDASFPLIYGEKGILTFDITGKTDDQSLVTFTAGDRYNVVPDYAECTLRVDLQDEFDKYLSFNGLHGAYEEGTYKVYGKRAHAMQPNLGINAAFILAQFLHEHIDNPFITFINEYLTFDHLGEKLRIDHFDDEMKEFTMNPAVYQYKDNEFKIGINCRFPKGWDKDNAFLNIKAAVKHVNFKYKIITDLPVHYVSKDDPLVLTLHQAYQKYTDDVDSELLTIGGGTYARSLKKAVAFGPNMPGRKDVAHQVDEYIYVEDLLKATAIYMEAIYQLSK